MLDSPMLPVRGRYLVFAIAGDPSFAERPFTWNLLFAREPEPDLEFTEVWLDETPTIGSPSPVKPPKQSQRRPLLWILFFLLISGGAYVATEPEVVTEYLGPLLSETPTSQPPVAQKPASPPAVPSKQSEQDWSFLAPAEPTAPSSPAGSPTATASASAKTPPTAAPSKQPEQDWSFLAPTQSTSSSSTALEPAPTTPAPLFSEGQRVSIRPDPTAPGQTVRLRQDAEGTKPGPAIPPGTVLTILDGDLQGSGWVYSVRSDLDTKGWLTEQQLKVTP